MPHDPLTLLLPMPRKITRSPGTATPGTTTTSPAKIPLTDQINPAAILHPQGYQISITPDYCHLIAHDPPGLFYAHQTLHQLRRLAGDRPLPCLEIEDHPDFPVRGFMLDISRDKVPTMPTLFSLIDLLAQCKINHLQLYTEHTFAYAGHETVWQHASPLTADEIRQLDAYCRQRFIDLVPNQNSFGHMERWLKHPRYLPLAEAPDGAQTPWGFRWQGPFSLCPTDPASLALLDDLYRQLLPNFTSRLFNVGCDETFDIGQGRSALHCQQRGTHAVYLEFLQKVQNLVEKNVRQMMYWGDIVLKSPELIPQLPASAIALNWGYEANHPFDTETAAFAAAGIPFFVCPGTSSWCSITGRTDNMLANQFAAATAGKNHGAIGYLNTDWGDYGHLQYLPFTYPGLAAGAAYSWCLSSNHPLPLDDLLNAHIFHDPSGILGALTLELGNLYQLTAKPIPNRSALFDLLVPSSTHRDPRADLTPAAIQNCAAALDRARNQLSLSRPQHPDAALIAAEYHTAIGMLSFACQEFLDPARASRGEELTALQTAHRTNWLSRNRPGGLPDSLSRLGSPRG